MSKTGTLTADEAIEQMSAQAITCRDYSHNWTPWYVTEWRGRGGFERGVRCGVCATARIESLDNWGRLVPGSRKYEYPEGYLVKGTGRLDKDFRAAIRLTSLLRSPNLQKKRMPKDQVSKRKHLEAVA